MNTMKRILILIIWILTSFTGVAQKYIEQYQKDANKVALNWLQEINNNQYENAYNTLTKQIKVRYEKSAWINIMTELMQEFGDIKTREVSDIYFKSEVEGLEDGFYVFIEYSVDYEKTRDHSEFLMLKQNDKIEWEISDYFYNFKEIEETDNQNK